MVLNYTISADDPVGSDRDLVRNGFPQKKVLKRVELGASRLNPIIYP